MSASASSTSSALGSGMVKIDDGGRRTTRHHHQPHGHGGGNNGGLFCRRRGFHRARATACSTVVVTAATFLLVTTLLVHQCLWLQRVLLLKHEHEQMQQQHHVTAAASVRRRRVGDVPPSSSRRNRDAVGSSRKRKPPSLHDPTEADGGAPPLQEEVESTSAEDEEYASASSEADRGGGLDASFDSNPMIPNDAETTVNDVQWMQSTDFRVDPDAFSDSWWMSVELFQPLNLTKVVAVEHACKRPLRLLQDKVRMPLDWFDLSVEHLSKWWKTVRVPDDDVATHRVVTYLTTYRDTALTSGIQQYQPYRHLMNNTMAIISFQPYRSKRRNFDPKANDQGQQLTVASLSATIASLMRVGMGRVVVVGYHRDDDDANEHETLIQKSFDAVAIAASASASASDSLTTIPTMTRQEARQAKETKSIRVVLGCELTYVPVTEQHVLNPAIAAFLHKGEVNLPRGALAAMQEALSGHDLDWTHQLLGRPSPTHHPWKHLYLTEPDTLLLTRPTTVPHMRQMLDDQFVLAPHRLQPIPYQKDFPESTTQNSSVITVEQWDALDRPIVALDALEGDVCCDEQANWYRPGSDPHFHPKCDDAWWRCGFTTQVGDHSRLFDHYQLMRLNHGTGITTLAGTGHGRRCIPARKSTCKRQMSVNHPDHPDNPWIQSYRAQDELEKSVVSPASSTSSASLEESTV